MRVNREKKRGWGRALDSQTLRIQGDDEQQAWEAEEERSASWRKDMDRDVSEERSEQSVERSEWTAMLTAAERVSRGKQRSAIGVGDMESRGDYTDARSTGQQR